MSISPLLEVVIGLALVYYILGLVVSWFTARITEATQQRSKDLKHYLNEILGEQKVVELLKLPQIESLKPIRYKNWLGVFTGQVAPKEIEKIPVSNLVDAIFELGGVVTKEGAMDELEKALDGWPKESPARDILLRWIRLKASDVDQLRGKMTMWFDGVMEKAAELYKAHARRIVIVLSFVVTFVLGVDTIDFATRLWNDAQLRALASANADLYLAQGDAAPDIGALIQALGDFGFKVGWWSSSLDLTNMALTPDGLAPLVWKLLGLLITFVAVAQGSSFWYDILNRLKGGSASSGEGSSSSGASAAEKA